MDRIEHIAGRLARVACSLDSPDAMLESAGLVSEAASEFEAFRRRQEEAPDAGPPPSSSAGPDPLTPETPAEQPRETLQTECV